MIRQRHPHLADELLGSLEGSSEGSTPSVREVLQAARDLVDGGFAAPSWGDLAAGARPLQRTRASPELDDDEQE